MRSLISSLVTLAALAGVFGLYIWMQPKAGQTVALPPSTSVAAPPQVVRAPLGAGKRPWVYSFQHDRLVSRFRAVEYDPQKDGFHVTDAESDFFLNGGQIIHLTGKRGVVYSTEAPSSGAALSPAQAPTRGRLDVVHLELLPFDGAEPTLTLDMPNIGFDFDTLRLYTQDDVDANRRPLPADQVPVIIRGGEYEFDGRGLIMRWNDRDQRLQLLEIAHGQRLLVRSPTKLTSPWATTRPAVSQAAAHGPALASADPTAAGMGSPPPAAVPTQQPVYHAVFSDDVQVSRAGQRVATADLMSIDFQPGSSKAKPAATQMSAVVSAPAPVVGSASSPAKPATVIATQPATVPADESVVINWTGMLRVTPVDGEPAMPVASGQAVVRLEGLPVIATYNGTTIRAAAMTYREPDGALRLDHSAELPSVLLDQERGTRFVTESLRYDPLTSLVTMSGISQLQLPMQAKPPEKPSELTASWRELGTVHLVGQTAGQPRGVDRIDLGGDVVVNHPQFGMNCRRLGIDLVPSVVAVKQAGEATPASEQIKQVTADGAVNCRLSAAGEPARGLTTDHLVLETIAGPDGKPVPSKITADGSVRAFDPDQELRAGHLLATLKPRVVKPADASRDKSGQWELDSLSARQSVHAALKNGVIADSDELQITTNDQQTLVRLLGKPASLTDGKGQFLTGPDIQLLPEGSQVIVTGPGTLHAAHQQASGGPGRPMDLAWNKTLNADISHNTIDARGKVIAQTTDADGTSNAVTGDSAHVVLADAPPTTRKSTAATQPVTANKQLHLLVVRGNVLANSLLTGAGGELLRRAQLQGDLLDYEVAAGRMEMPGPGRLLLEDHRPGGSGGDTGSTRGAAAMQWEKGLTYDQAARQISFAGNVLLGFQSQDNHQPPLRMRADKVIATLEPAPVAPSTATTHPADTTTKLRLAHLTAAENVRVTAKTGSFECSTLDYDPATGKVIARGTEDTPGRTTDENNASTGEFQELIFDAATQQIDSVKGVRGSIRR